MGAELNFMDQTTLQILVICHDYLFTNTFHHMGANVNVVDRAIDILRINFDWTHNPVAWDPLLIAAAERQADDARAVVAARAAMRANRIANARAARQLFRPGAREAAAAVVPVNNNNPVAAPAQEERAAAAVNAAPARPRWRPYDDSVVELVLQCLCGCL